MSLSHDEVVMIGALGGALIWGYLRLPERARAALRMVLGAIILYVTVEASGRTWSEMLPLVLTVCVATLALLILWDAVVVGRWRRP